jgi:hypothetical protein
MRPALEVADIFRRYGEAFRRNHGAHLGRIERRIMAAIEACRTVPPAFAPSRNSEDLVPPGMIAPGCGSKVDELRGVCRGGDFRAA